jgi:hypothetical protein
MKLKVTIDMQNDAFAHQQGIETARILRDLADTIEVNAYLGGLNTRLFDVNGNRVGEAVTTGKR